MLRNFIIMMCLSAVSIACINKSKGGKTRKRIGNQIVEVNIIDDTLYDGIAKYYTIENTLLGEVEYSNGIKNGFSKRYFKNGIVSDSLNYRYGLENGFHYSYDTFGRIEYIDYFSNGRKVGGIWYFLDGKIKLYDFLKFDGNLIYRSEYDVNEKVTKYRGEIIVSTLSRKIVDGQAKCNLFLYLIDPPNISIKYAVGIKDQKTNKRQLLPVRITGKMYSEILLPCLDSTQFYYVQANYDDSLNRFHKVHIFDFY